jgi:glucose-1-phosphate thymidylyltransferase
MKGVILAGGLATRLRPLTLVTNKHLLPIYHQPMIYYALNAMKKAGIKEVLLTSSPDHAGHFATLLKSGEEFDLRLYYAVQQNPKGGIPEAISLAEEFAHHDQILVILGDNIFTCNLKESVENFSKQKEGAVVFGVNKNTDSKQYGVIEIDQAGKVLSIEEKPENPKSDIAQTGIYIYDKQVFSYIKTLTASKRGELEVTDLNNIYLEKQELRCVLIDWWIDAGTSFDELLFANEQVAKMVKTGKL